jgi:hypothetical protein
MLADAHTHWHAHWQRACVARRKHGGAARGRRRGAHAVCLPTACTGHVPAQISAREQTDLCGGIESAIAELGRAPATPGSSCPTVRLALPPPGATPATTEHRATGQPEPNAARRCRRPFTVGSVSTAREIMLESCDAPREHKHTGRSGSAGPTHR